MSDRADRIAAIRQRVVQRVAELPDRTSPDDWPEAMLVTADELSTIVTEELDAALARLTSERGWQPIDTAPENQSILIFIPNWDHYGPGIYRAILVNMGTGRRWHTTGWAVGRDLEAGYPQPTHWAPLPAPPQEDQMTEMKNVDESYLNPLENPSVGSPFHWRDGFYFQRTKLGAVLFTLPARYGGGVKVIPPHEWASIVAAVSEHGDHAQSHADALAFHGKDLR